MPAPRSKVSPILSFLDERGYSLSDRIWNINTSTAAQIDALLDEAISSGMSSVTLAKRLEQYLLPGRMLPETSKPYGTTGSYNARRLARSEITRAHSMATKAAAIANPFVDRMFYHLSNSHKDDGDICEEWAALSEEQGGFEPSECPVPEADTHPHCVTAGQLVDTLRGKLPIEQVEQNDFVLTHTGQYQRVIYAWNKKHSGTVYKIETAHGMLELTGEHPVLTDAGWLNAESLKVGNKVIYAGKRTQSNLGFNVSDNRPSDSCKRGIAFPVAFLVMPVATVCFNTYKAIRESEIKTITQHSKLLNIFQLSFIKGISKHSFETTCAGIAVSAITTTKASLQIFRRVKSFLALVAFFIIATASKLLSFGHLNPMFNIVHWIVQFFGIGNLFTGFRSTQRCECNVNVFKVCFPHFVSGGYTSFRAIALPLIGNRLATSTQGNAVSVQYVTQYPISNAVFFKDRWRTVNRVCIEFIQDVQNGFTQIALQAQNMILHHINIMGLGMSKTGSNLNFAADGAGVFHDNLSLLSLENVVGAASRNTVVSGLITPSQAHQYYSIVEAVKECKYDGLVYNMHVEHDNSYTVNNAVVHNCMCYTTSGVIPQDDAIAAIRDGLDADEEAAFTDDGSVDAFTLALWGSAAWTVFDALFG